jgi:hypothetical protein
MSLNLTITHFPRIYNENKKFDHIPWILSSKLHEYLYIWYKPKMGFYWRNVHITKRTLQSWGETESFWSKTNYCTWYQAKQIASLHKPQQSKIITWFINPRLRNPTKTEDFQVPNFRINFWATLRVLVFHSLSSHYHSTFNTVPSFAKTYGICTIVAVVDRHSLTGVRNHCEGSVGFTRPGLTQAPKGNL